MVKKLIWVAIVIGMVVSPGAAQFQPQIVPQQEAVIYEGDATGGVTPVTLSGWGSGKAEETGALSYIGAKVLRVMTHGYYAGARLDLGRPVNLGDYWGKPNAYVRLTLRPALARPVQVQTTTPGTPGTYTARPGFRVGGQRRGRRERDEDDYEAPIQPAPTTPSAIPGTRPGATSATATSSQPAFRAEKLGLVLVSDKRMVVLRDVKIEQDKADAQGWVKVAAPLALFQPLSEVKAEEGENLQRVIIFGDRSDIFYVGDVRLSLIPITPISLQVKVTPVETQPGKQVKFTATASAGLAPLEIVWDFDDSDDLQEDAEGNEVVNIYYEIGEYTATCTVNDLTGGNPPFKRTMGVRIAAR